MYKAYEEILNRYRLTHSRNYIKSLRIVLNKLPSPSKLTKSWILDFLASIQNKNTRKTYFTLLKIILKELGMLELVKDIRIKPFKSNITRSDLLTTEEIHLLLRSCKSTKERAIVEFLVESGCRASELLSLNKEDIVIKKDFVIVTLQGKTGVRTIPLLRSNLNNFLLYISYTESGRVFDITYETLLNIIRRLYKRSGVRKRSRTIHIFRHTKTTYLLESGIQERIIKMFMGWSPNSSMLNHYTHLTSKSIENIFARVYGLEVERVKELYPAEERELFKELFS